MQMFWDVLKDTVLDCLKMLPVLYISYLLMELLEKHAGEKMNLAVAKVGKAGPLIGALLGVIPQCGFSGAVAGFYAAGIATLGTMISVFMSTSDEMLPLLLSSGCEAGMIGRILLVKAAGGLLFGYLVDLVFRGRTKTHIETLCKQDECGCESHTPAVSAAIHCGKVLGVIFLISLVLNLLMEYAGRDFLNRLLMDSRVLTTLLSALFGLIPSCSISVLLTELFTQQLLPASAFLSGLYANAGVGLVVLFRQNRHTRENLLITLLLYVCSVGAGFLAGLLF